MAWRPPVNQQPQPQPPQSSTASYSSYNQQPPPAQYQSQIPPQEYQQIQQWFQAVDTDRSGQINVQELHRCLSMGGNNFDINVVSRLILAFDSDRSGEIGIHQNKFQNYLHLNINLQIRAK